MVFTFALSTVRGCPSARMPVIYGTLPPPQTTQGPYQFDEKAIDMRQRNTSLAPHKSLAYYCGTPHHTHDHHQMVARRMLEDPKATGSAWDPPSPP